MCPHIDANWTDREEGKQEEDTKKKKKKRKIKGGRGGDGFAVQPRCAAHR